MNKIIQSPIGQQSHQDIPLGSQQHDIAKGQIADGLQQQQDVGGGIRHDISGDGLSSQAQA